MIPLSSYVRVCQMPARHMASSIFSSSASLVRENAKSSLTKVYSSALYLWPGTFVANSDMQEPPKIDSYPRMPLCNRNTPTSRSSKPLMVWMFRFRHFFRGTAMVSGNPLSVHIGPSVRWVGFLSGSSLPSSSPSRRNRACSPVSVKAEHGQHGMVEASKERSRRRRSKLNLPSMHRGCLLDFQTLWILTDVVMGSARFGSGLLSCSSINECHD
ncbi:hypothetical protein B0T13DRAFT_117736 [Neurospora crassa]|nr:hypothetical protein B0T13DRAFT_117736 [Neurospora crassa]